jgi:glycosyltransferase involved in cell wall biosynthesis
MLQWLGPDFSSRILYNDYREGKYVSVILTLATMEEQIIPAAVYSVSADGRFALTLDFSRLYELRPGYGYYNVPEKTKGIALPDTTAIWKVNLETGEVTDILKYVDFAKFQPRPEMMEEEAVHKVNHIMLSPNGKRFMVLYRWFCGQRKYTRLITCNVDGTDMYVLSDDDMVSHCFWKNNSSILAFANKKDRGLGYYLMKDKTQNYVYLWPELTGDGHPSFSPDGTKIVTDSYPDRARIAYLRVMDADISNSSVETIARVFAPFKYDNDTRCDLHPRWNHKSSKICFDGIFEGHRGLYMIETGKTEKKVLQNIKVLFVTDSMRQRFGVTSVIMNILEYWTNDNITIDIMAYEDSEPEMVEKAQKLGAKVFLMPRLSLSTPLKFIRFQHEFFEKNKYDIVHSHFNQVDQLIFPIARKNCVKKCISHSHNTKLSNNRMKAIRNRLMCLNIANNADYLAACSELAGKTLFGKKFLTKEKSLIIHNGVDCDAYKYSEDSRKQIREELEIDKDEIIIGHVGSFKPEKNQMFLLEVFKELLNVDKRYKLVFVGDGQLIEDVKQKCSQLKLDAHVIFAGLRKDVPRVLSAFDIFVMPSIYEGLPVAGVEAQVNGLSCIFSDAITKEVDLSGVCFLPLSESKTEWVKNILNMKTEHRVGNYKQIKNMGFDIREECEKIAMFYNRIVNN